MNTKSIMSSLLAASLLTSTFAFARDYRVEDRQRNGFSQQQFAYQNNGFQNPGVSGWGNQQQAAESGWSDNRRGRDNRGEEQRMHRMNRGHVNNMYYINQNANAHFNHGWQRGQVVPVEFRRDRYVVNNWQNYRLSEPPRGYRWIQSDGDFILASIATGIISQIIWNSVGH